jgi:hypothetical protein
MEDVKYTLEDLKNNKDIFHLIARYQSGTMNLVSEIKPGGGTDLFELREAYGTHVVFRENNDIIRIAGICDKNNQDKVFDLLRDEFQ